MNEWKIDAPLLSPKRLYNAVRMYFYFMLRADNFYPLIFYLKWYRRKEARFRKLGR